MEDKQLDFNRPFLSVRRFSSMMTTPAESVEKKTSDNSPSSKIPPLPVYKSELKSGPVRKSGTVPFKWEHSPGQPKDKHKSQASILGQLTTTAAPKLPPGRVSFVKHRSSENGLDGIMVPTSQTGTTPSVSQNMSRLDMNAKDQYGGEVEETGCSGSDDADEEAFTDALDTLSRTDSFYLNCSASGVSGLDGPDIIPFKNFSADPQAWDFMMGRFLPAAKAMASETPPYAARKPPTTQELPSNKQTVAVQLGKQPSVSPFSSKNFHPHGLDYESRKSEDEDGLSETEDLSTKACGLLPQFLLKSSLCLLNPIPGMKMQTKKPISVRSIRTKSSNLGNSSETDFEHVSAFEKGTTGQLRTNEHHVDKSELNSKPSQISGRSGYSPNQDGSALYRDLQGNNISAHPRGLCYTTHQEKGSQLVSEQSRICRANEFEAHQEKSSSLGKLFMSAEGSESESFSAVPVVEKTIYIDSLDTVRSLDSTSSDKIKLIDPRQDFSRMKGRVESKTLLIDYSADVIKDLNLNSEKVELQGKNIESVDSSFLLSLCKSTHDHELQMDATNGSRRDCKLIQESSKSTCPKLAKNEKIDLKRQLRIGRSGNEANPDKFGRTNGAEHVRIEIGSSFNRKSSNQEPSNDSYSQPPPLALPLPLPKSPSESWLSRALPVVSSKNSSSRSSSLGTHNYYRSSKASDPKWENRVGTHNVQHGHSQFSEKLLTPIREE